MINKYKKGIKIVKMVGMAKSICWHYKELFRIPDGGKIIITSAWGEKTELSCRYIDETHTEVGSNLLHICEFAERMERNGAAYEPKTEEPPQAQKTVKHKDHER